MGADTALQAAHGGRDRQRRPGRYIEKVFQQDASVRITAVCDVYEPNLEAGLAAAKNQAKAHRNYKALLDAISK